MLAVESAFHPMPANVSASIDAYHHPQMSHHSRSASVSSASSRSSQSRPTSAAGSAISPDALRNPPVGSIMPPTPEDLYRHYPVGSGRQPVAMDHNSHTRHSSGASQSTTYSLGQALATPGDSPPGMGGVPVGKPHLPRSTHLRARAAAAPYARDNDSMYSSSSDTEDLAMFLTQGRQEYSAVYPTHMAPSQHYHQLPPHHHLGQEAVGAFGRMTLGPDHALEQLAANVRSATTTSSSDRAKQIFVQAWLTANYAPYPDGNVPRQGLYFSYRRICDQYGIPHINTATLGKAIRLCFPTIKTRRLGVRGNSKYHYCGIRPATAAEAEFLQDYVRRTNNLNPQNGAERGGSQDRQSGQEDEDDEDDSEGGQSKRNSLSLGVNGVPSIPSNGPKSPKFSYDMDISDKTPTTNSLMSAAQQNAAQQKASYSGHASIRRHSSLQEGTAVMRHSPPSQAAVEGFLPSSARTSVRQLPNFPSIEEALGPNPTSAQAQVAREVWGWFESHLDQLLECVRTLKFEMFEIHLRNFWQGLTGDHREVVHAPPVAGLMSRADAMVYDEILESLRSQMLSDIPTPALAHLRALADKMEKVLLTALENYGNTFVEPKVELGARFGHLVLRFLDMYQVTQALATVLTNPKQLVDMRRSWQSIDFESVRNQSALVCNCRHEDLIQLLEVDFVALLTRLTESQEPVREVMIWADECCDRLMSRSAGAEDRATMSSRSVLIRWGYVTSQIMRDLTIRSDPAFGAFQILKLFLDDWISLTVLRTVALSTNSVAASVEPMMQQQFFTLSSPLAGQDSFPHSLDRSVQGLMSNTPTGSSMLASINDAFPHGPLDANSFNTNFFMETSPTSHGTSFAEFQTGHSNPFDVAGFPQDLGLPQPLPIADSPKLSDGESEQKKVSAAPVKQEGSA